MSQPKVYTTKVYSSITTAIVATDVAVKGDDEPDDDVLLSVDDGMSQSQLVFGIIKGVVGPAILYMPHGFKEGGYGFAIPMLWLSWILFTWSMSRLLELWFARRCSYAEMMRDAFGSGGMTMLQIFIAIQQCGLCITYFVFIANNLHQVTGIGAQWLCIIQLVVHVPLACVRDLKSFRYTNIIATIIIGICVLMTVESAIQDDVEHGKALQLFNGDRFYEFVGTAIFAWEGMAALCLPLQASAAKDTRDNFLLLFVCTTASIMAVYTAFALINLDAYGADTETVLTDNVVSLTVRRTVQVLYSIAVVFTFPLQLHQGVQMSSDLISQWCPTVQKIPVPSDDDESTEHELTELEPPSDWNGTACRTALVTLLACISIGLIDHLALFVSLIGSLLGIPLAFIFPSFIHCRLSQYQSPLVTRTNYVVIGIGVLLCVISTGITFSTRF